VAEVADKDHELIDVLDENGVKTGEVLTRGEIHKKGLWHRAIVVAVIDEQNRVLIQQRSSAKKKNPGMWDISIAGHVEVGQDSVFAAVREINEETEIDINEKVMVRDFRFMLSFRDMRQFAQDFVENQFYDFFILKRIGLNVDEMNFQKSEVQALRTVGVSELLEMIDGGELVERPAVYRELTNYLLRM
jgi:Isopentenyldiphosphate isomerase